jgi:hypothetical protein
MFAKDIEIFSYVTGLSTEFPLSSTGLLMCITPVDEIYFSGLTSFEGCKTQVYNSV